MSNTNHLPPRYRNALNTIEPVNGRMTEILKGVRISNGNNQKQLHIMRSLLEQWKDINVCPTAAELLDFACTATALGESVLDKELSFIGAQAVESVGAIIDEREAINRIWEYYAALCDLKMICAEVVETGKTLSKQVVPDKSKERIQPTMEDIMEKLQNIGRAMRASMPGSAGTVMSAVESFESSLSSEPDGMEDAFHILRDRIYQFALGIQGKMFDFVSVVHKLAAKKNFALKEIKTELVPPSIEILEVYSSYVAVPVFEPPRIVFTFKPD